MLLEKIALSAANFMNVALQWVMSGLRAFTSCDYWDTGNKLGRQRVAAFIQPLNAGSQIYIGFRTGAEPVVITARALQQLGSTRVDYSAQANRGFTPPVNPANVVPICNPNNLVQVPSNVQVWFGVTPTAPTAETVEYLKPYPVLAAGAAAVSRLATDSFAGKYTLEPNTDHVFTINNVGPGNASVVHWLVTFREGKLDLPAEG